MLRLSGSFLGFQIRSLLAAMRNNVFPRSSSGEISTAAIQRRAILSSNGGHEIPAVLSLQSRLLFAGEKISNGRKSMILIPSTARSDNRDQEMVVDLNGAQFEKVVASDGNGQRAEEMVVNLPTPMIEVPAKEIWQPLDKLMKTSKWPWMLAADQSWAPSVLMTAVDERRSIPARVWDWTQGLEPGFDHKPKKGQFWNWAYGPNFNMTMA